MLGFYVDMLAGFMDTQHACKGHNRHNVHHSLGFDESKELLACLRISEEFSEHGARYCSALRLLNASHHHAHVCGFDDDSYSSWLDSIHQSRRYLLR